MIDTSRINVVFSSDKKSEDYLIWLSIAKQGSIRFIDDVLTVRIDSNGVSANKLSMARRRWQIYREHEGLSLLQASYYFAFYTVTGLLKHINK